MLNKRHGIVLNTIGALIASMCLCVSVYAESKVGVIMPELRAPYKIIFESVVDGIDDKLNQRTSTLMLDKDYDPNEIARWLRKDDINAVITLGRLGQKASTYVPSNTPIVLGALLSTSGDVSRYPGVALTPDPKSLFQMLYRIDASRKKVVVVHNPARNQWVVDLAKRQSAANGVQLVEYKASDIKQAAKIYDEIFSSNDLKNTALWLLQDRKVVDSKVVLPFILEKAWQKKIVVFSSAVSHVKKGVLFSMYPDNRLHGEQLAEMVLSSRSGRSKVENKIYPSKGLQDAINIRTAEHLGLDLSRSELREFDVVFPLSN